jgi:hypothetical protein
MDIQDLRIGNGCMTVLVLIGLIALLTGLVNLASAIVNFLSKKEKD